MEALSTTRVKTYIVDANDALEFKLVRTVDDLEDDDLEKTFKPEMSHQVFGEKETIFGYQDLKVKLYYSAGSLQTYLGVTYSEKIPESICEGMEPDNINKKIVPWISPDHTNNLDTFIKLCEEDECFHPDGELVSSFYNSDYKMKRFYEVYIGDIKKKSYLEYHKRLRTFSIWYIDAANYVDVDDENWVFFNLYEKYKNENGVTCYDTVGYATVYLYYAYPRHIRPRIAQFLILPPFQTMGLGPDLLRNIYRYFIKDNRVTDITVEDPSPAFQRTRDFVDASEARHLPSFAAENLVNGFNKIMAQEAKEKLKMNKMQARRIYEILRLLQTDTTNENEYKQYRLDVKKRLNIPYKREEKKMKKLELAMQASKNKDGQDCSNKNKVLPTLEQRIEALDAEYKSLEKEYNRVLFRIKFCNEY